MPNVNQVVLKNGLILNKGFNSSIPTSYWRLDESSGNAVDSTDSNTLTDVDTVGSETDPIMGVVRTFNGSSEYLAKTGIVDGSNLMPDSASGAKFSISAWCKFTAIPTGAFQDMCVVGCGNVNASFEKYRIMFRIESGVRYAQAAFWRAAGTVANCTVTGYTPVVGVWYHVVSVADGSNVRFWINNVEQSGGSQSYTTLATEGADNRFGIGIEAGTPTSFFNGSISKVMIFKNIALTISEINELYNDGRGMWYGKKEMIKSNFVPLPYDGWDSEMTEYEGEY